MKTRITPRFLKILLLIVLLPSCNVVFSAQRALLIGVGDYQIPNKNLPGIDVDIELMKDALTRLGFKNNEIKVLYNQTATYQNIQKAITSWLVKDVNKNDRVILYFGGHGSRIPDSGGDEKDHVDEVLLAHDAAYIETPNGRSLANVVVDDVLASWLAGIPSETVLVLVDACNSGTITRSINLKNRSLGVEVAYPKAFNYEGMPESNSVSFTRALQKSSLNTSNNYVSISAAKDNEFALATEQGSYFTLGIIDAINKASKNMNTITIEELHKHADMYIERKVSKGRRYHPQIYGNEKLAKGAYELFKITQGYGPKWSSIDKLSNNGKFLSMMTNKKEYQIGDDVEISVDIPTEGHLNIVSIDAYDQATVLYPNKFNKDNYVNKSTLTIPTSKMPFRLPIVEPAGPTLIAAFLTKSPVNLYSLSHENRDASGLLQEIFATLSYSGVRAIALSPNKTNLNNGHRFYSHVLITNIHSTH